MGFPPCSRTLPSAHDVLRNYLTRVGPSRQAHNHSTAGACRARQAASRGAWISGGTKSAIGSPWASRARTSVAETAARSAESRITRIRCAKGATSARARKASIASGGSGSRLATTHSLPSKSRAERVRRVGVVLRIEQPDQGVEAEQKDHACPPDRLGGWRPSCPRSGRARPPPRRRWVGIRQTAAGDPGALPGASPSTALSTLATAREAGPLPGENRRPPSRIRPACAIVIGLNEADRHRSVPPSRPSPAGARRRYARCGGAA